MPESVGRDALRGYGARPESVVALFVYLASDAAGAITGQALDVKTWRRKLGIRR